MDENKEMNTEPENSYGADGENLQPESGAAEQPQENAAAEQQSYYSQPTQQSYYSQPTQQSAYGQSEQQKLWAVSVWTVVVRSDGAAELWTVSVQSDVLRCIAGSA